MSKLRIGLLAGAVAAGAVTAMAPSAALAATASATAGTCPKGDVCVWSGKNATGTRCNWTGDDPDWQGGAIQCRPHRFKVNSIWNNGYTSNPYNKVRFFASANYQNELYDPVSVTSKPINAANVSIRSHQWSR
ncbi:peptidase inhibitor family I36 protein [Actinomadura sp. BRA 177]|uniref:peptidase inhibitor family I36 protein n=1 Tax=Actinomadura sp. BRA 177 TaxID=2745202 RepID=UPI00159623E8|nr:peptidase inhibitor family I36 protein [Actinomadura sp. BRA 177]NVI86492.1 peptidase inhibitor family I36 protein [Actinomadura sp. BRA 177]